MFQTTNQIRIIKSSGFIQPLWMISLRIVFPSYIGDYNNDDRSHMADKRIEMGIVIGIVMRIGHLSSGY